MIYHFTKRQNLEAVLREGLRPGAGFHTLGSVLRQGACYFWLAPDNDAMGYIGNEDYICLEVAIDTDSCMVAPMDVISAAFYNFLMTKKGEHLWDYRQLAALYDSMAVPYRDYNCGMFRTPEIVVQKPIKPHSIRVLDCLDVVNQFSGNREVYNASLPRKLPEDAVKVAIHDDSSGLLTSYFAKNLTKFYTVEL